MDRDTVLWMARQISNNQKTTLINRDEQYSMGWWNAMYQVRVKIYNELREVSPGLAEEFLNLSDVRYEKE